MTSRRAAVAAMLSARSVAIVGASPKPDGFGARMVAEVGKSEGIDTISLVNPRYATIGGARCLPSLHELDDPPDVVLLGVGPSRLLEQLTAAADIGARSAVIFGSAHGDSLRASLRSVCLDSGMALCGAGCMGFVNVARGVRAIGYVEPDPILPGPISVVTHSGSMFSTLLRSHRGLGFRLVVSSGQELVTTAADYLEYALDDPRTTVIGLVLETVRDAPRLVRALQRASRQGVMVVTLAIGGSQLGASMVTAHSGAIAGASAMWEALAESTGMMLVSDLAEFADTLELLSLGRPIGVTGPGTGIATVHDSGAERTLIADLASAQGVPFAMIGDETRSRLSTILEDGLEPANPLDVWGSGRGTRDLFAGCLQALSEDPNVAITALAVDVIREYDGGTAYLDAVLEVSRSTTKPIAVIAGLASAVDGAAAQRMRAAGVPVLEGSRSGLVALRHALAAAEGLPDDVDTTTGFPMVEERRRRWMARLADGPLASAEALDLLAAYGIDTVASATASDEESLLAAVCREGPGLSFPVVLKTDEPAIHHKSDVGGVVLGLTDADQLARAYRELAGRLGPRVVVSATAQAGVELALGVVHDRHLGPLVVVAAGGVFIELLTDRAVARPPLTTARAERLVDRLKIRAMLDGWRGTQAADVGAIVDAIVAVGQLAIELGDAIAAVDVNPLICGPAGAIAVDALVVPS